MRVAGQAALRRQVEGVDGKALLGRDIGEGNGVAGLPDGASEAEQQTEAIIALDLNDGAGQVHFIVDFDLGGERHESLTARSGQVGVLLHGRDVIYEIRTFEQRLSQGRREAFLGSGLLADR